MSAAVVIVVLRGLAFGIEFTGGTQYRVPLAASDVTQDNADAVREAIADAGIEATGNPTVTTAGQGLLVQIEELTQEESDEVVAIISDTVPVTGEISQDEISASWGKQVGQRAVLGVLVFLVLVMLFIWRLLPRMEDVGRRRSWRWSTTSRSPSASMRCPASR